MTAQQRTRLVERDASGLLFGLGAYGIWGVFPAFFPLLKPAGPGEILAHRVVWTLAFMAVLLLVMRRLGDLRGIDRRTWLLLACASVLISTNWLELTYGGRPPVVLTGAARAADDPDADGPGNLRDALAVASSPSAWESGVLLSFAGAVFAPLGTTKMGTTMMGGTAVFGGTDPVGSVTAERFSMTGTKQRAHLGAVPQPPRVDIAMAYPGADGAAIDAFAAAGARAVVVEAMGSGNAGTPVVEAVRRATACGVSVAVTTRVPGGHTHAGYGPGHELVEAGAVMVPRLGSSQARVLMMAAIGNGLSVPDVVERWG